MKYQHQRHYQTFPPNFYSSSSRISTIGALLNLDLTCRKTNFKALNHFIFVNDLLDPREGEFSSYKNPPETLAVLRSALFVNHLKHFYFALNPGIERMRREVSGICVLAARLDAMEVFKISFHHFDPPFFPQL
jgi:hypothetical protein